MLFNVLFQFDWYFSEPKKFGHGSSPYNIPPFKAFFYDLEVPGIGLISLSKTDSFGSVVNLPRISPETNHTFLFFHVQKFLVYGTPPYLFGCINFRFDLLTDEFSVLKYFSFSPVGISPSVCRFSSSSMFVLISLYPFFSDVSGFPISNSLSSSISPSLSDSDSDSLVRFCIIFNLPFQYVLKYLVPLDVFPVDNPDTVAVLRCDFVSDLRCPLFLLFGLKKNRSRNVFSLNQFPTFGGYSVFGSAYCVCIFFWNLPSKDFLLWFFLQI